MTTHFSVWGVSGSLITQRDDQRDFAEERLWHWIKAVDDAANRFRSDAEISHVNAARGERRELSETFTLIMTAALDAARATDGLCTPTVLDALTAIGYDRDYDVVRRDGATRRTPPRPAPGLDAIDFDPQRRTLRLAPRCRLDVGATAKALTADLVANDVAPTGGVVVEIGGDVAVRGEGPQGAWAIGVSDSLQRRHDEPRVALRHGGLATSSTRVRTWRANGALVHHVIDPRTGAPADATYVTASVAAASCVEANAFATAALIAEDAAYRVAQAGWAGRLVRADGTVDVVGGWPAERGAA